MVLKGQNFLQNSSRQQNGPSFALRCNPSQKLDNVRVGHSRFDPNLAHEVLRNVRSQQIHDVLVRHPKFLLHFIARLFVQKVVRNCIRIYSEVCNDAERFLATCRISNILNLATQVNFLWLTRAFSVQKVRYQLCLPLNVPSTDDCNVVPALL